MSLSSISSGIIVYANGTVNDPGFDDIRSAIVNILGTGSQGYGYLGINSFPVSNTKTITSSDWLSLVPNFQRIWQHQTNTSYNFINPPPASGDLVRAAWVEELVSSIDTAIANQYNRAPVGQRNTYSLFSQWTVSSPSRLDWGTTLEHQVTLTWADNLSADYFFNLGGRITFNLSYLAGTYSGDDAAWTAYIDSNNFTLNSQIYDRTAFLEGSQSLGIPPDPNGNSITITVTKIGGNQLVLSTTLNNTGANTNLYVANTFTYEYSINAIVAPQPSVVTNRYFGDHTTPVLILTKILSVTNPSTFTWSAGGSSASQTIIIRNIGNTNVTVNSITFTDATGVVHSNNGFLNGTITVGNSVNFTLSYSGNTVGTFTSSFTVNSNADAGPITINTTEVVQAASFDFTLNPPNWNTSYSGQSSISQTFVIQPTNGSFSSYTASLSGNDTAFSIDTSNQTVGPTITFTPPSNSNTHNDTLTVTVNGITHTAPISISYTALTTANLGTWVSALAAANAVIGMSYDIIAGQRYLTIGLGMGADGSTLLSSGGSSYVLVDNLGINADSNFATGTQMFKSADPQNSASWCSFLTQYAVWPNSTGASGAALPAIPLPGGIDATGFTVNYRFNVNSSGVYTLTYSADDDTLITVYNSSGVRYLASLPISAGNYGAASNHTQSYTTTFNLTPGTWYLTHTLYNYSQAGGIGLSITNSSGAVIWSTLNQIRSSTIYRYWAEVYRFPISTNGTPQTLSCYDSPDGITSYCIKNTFPVLGQYHYGYFFRGHNQFIIANDGLGNLSITMNPLVSLPGVETDNDATLYDFIQAFYYYTQLSDRYTQLDNGAVNGPSTTNFFTGFSANGTVTTVIRPVPTINPILTSA